MKPTDLKRARQTLGLSQNQLAGLLKTTRRTIARYEGGARRIPGMVEVMLQQLAASPRVPMAGIVAAGEPIEPLPQAEVIEVPPSMLRKGENFALRVKGDSMRDEGILPGDLVLVRKQLAAVLAERVEFGQFTRDEALSVARSILYQSPQTLLGFVPRQA